MEKREKLLGARYLTCPRSNDAPEYWAGVRRICELGDRYEYSGVLVYTGTDVPVDPWVTAQWLLASTQWLSPLVAVNPVLNHPFTVARQVASLTQLYHRRVCLNLVAGASRLQQASLDDTLDHDARYDRLAEYAAVIKSLLASGTPSVCFDGSYYGIANLGLAAPPPTELFPHFYLAGQSPAALKLAEQLPARQIGMLQPSLRSAEHSMAAHFGMVTRASNQEAWYAARRLFPEVKGREALARESAGASDAHWRRRLLQLLDSDERSAGYWLEPFARMQLDCPVFVGSYQECRQMLCGLADSGVDEVVLDLPPSGTEFAHVQQAMI